MTQLKLTIEANADLDFTKPNPADELLAAIGRAMGCELVASRIFTDHGARDHISVAVEAHEIRRVGVDSSALHIDRPGLHAAFDKWLDAVSLAQPCIEDGDFMSITFNGGRDGYSKDDQPLGNFSIEERKLVGGF